MKLNTLDWYEQKVQTEAEQPTAAQAPTSDPNAQQPIAAGGPPQPPQQQPQDNVEDDPVTPDEDEDSPEKDFEQWRHDFLELSIKGDVGEMLDSIGQVRDREGLEASQRKFIEDNVQILLYRGDANVTKATKTIRNLIKDDLDRTNPATTVMQHITATLEQDQVLTQVLFKLAGLGGMKGDLHRKWLCALLGAAQIGGGGSREDLLYSDKDYTINFSTRFATQFGEVTLGKWSLKSDDAQRYLTEPEVDRLSEGSPEEKQTLRRRIIVESISDKFEKRAFLVHVVLPDFSICSLGWDLGDSLLAAYKEGKIVVRGKQNDDKDAMISDTGEIITLVDIDVLFVKETGESDPNGKPEMVEVPFIERRDSVLYLCADMETLQNASSSLSGMFFRGTPYGGNQAEALSISQCIPSVAETLGKRCA